MRIIWPRTTSERDTLETENGKRKIAIENESSEIALVNMQLRLHATRGGGSNAGMMMQRGVAK